ncbi:hypothetical protein IQ07DRAFT_618060 [Pyrenochaeta sp. DS3sAY3a]|nr:hypothetical protein IQ07DRAFT_618060 [Pyrenochaeta sp. DS3sAY3a]
MPPKHTSPPPSLHTFSSSLLPSTTLSHPPSHPTSAPLTPLISALLLHPTLEAALHILNADLPSAHFLLRHMQAPPAVEGMLLHAILHRVEGDFGNARAWAGDVRDACEGFVPKRRERGERLGMEVGRGCRGGDGVGGTLVEFVYGSVDAGGDVNGETEQDEGMALISDVEVFRGKKKLDQGVDEERQLEGRARRELERVMEWCVAKFGDGRWEDARSAWVRGGEEVRRIGEGMVSGGKGWREF